MKNVFGTYCLLNDNALSTVSLAVLCLQYGKNVSINCLNLCSDLYGNVCKCLLADVYSCIYKSYRPVFMFGVTVLRG